MPKFSVGESFSVSLISSIEKVWMRGGGFQDFPSKIFGLLVPKTFVQEPFSVSKCFLQCSENVCGSEGRGRVPSSSVTFFLSHSAKNFRSGILLCGVSENFN